jgi:serine protease Do
MIMKRHHLTLFILLLASMCFSFHMSAKTSDLRRTPTVIAVESTSPAVVNISTEQIVQLRGRYGFSDPFFDQFFRDFLDPYPRRQYTQNSLGSGVIIDKQGHVLTNQHVIQRASRITVILADNREFEAELVGSDTHSDLAVVKILTDERLPVAHMGTSEDLMIGEPVIAIGNPFGLSHTITTGVISALNRAIRVSDDQVFRGFIQTDAPINPGNSGGPLINILGDVIGINTAIYGDAQGIGFAIPIDRARRIADELINHGEVRNAWVGLSVQDITPSIAKYFEYQSSDGVLVGQVMDDSAAERAGLEQGDIIVSLDNKPVRDMSGYYALLNEYTPDNGIVFALIRDGKRREISVQAEEFSVEHAVRAAYQAFGFEVTDITEKLARTYRLQSSQGVVITKVRQNTPAAQVGIEPGDIIRKVDDMAVTELTEFRKAMAAAYQQPSAVFLVQRGSRGYYVMLDQE